MNLPIPAWPLPLPVAYHLHYGAPLYLHTTDGRPDGPAVPTADADDPHRVAAAATRVHDALVDLIDVGRRQRRGRP